MQEYIDKLVKIARLECVDWFLPVSHIYLAEADAKAKVIMEDQLRIKALTLDSPELVQDLDDKVKFLEQCRALDLRVPEFRR